VDTVTPVFSSTEQGQKWWKKNV